jgi:DNA-binding MarR family transcriptional regulator
LTADLYLHIQIYKLFAAVLVAETSMGPRVSPMVGGLDIREVAGCSCLRLRKAARSVSRLYDQALAPAGLTVTQFGLISTLFGALAAGQAGLSIGRLAAEMGMDPTTLNRSLKPLEAEGLVDSGRDGTDNRVRTLHVTQAGRVKLAEAAPLWAQAQACLYRRLGRDTVLALNGLLAVAAAQAAP